MKDDEGFFVVRDIVPVTWKEKVTGTIQWAIVIFGLAVWWTVTH